MQIRRLIFLFGVPAIFATAYFIGASARLYSIPLCGFKILTGIDCPGCGLTRSFALLLHGRIAQSISLHPLGIVVALFLVWMFLRELLSMIRNKTLNPIFPGFLRDRIIIVFVIAMLINWLFKLVKPWVL